MLAAASLLVPGTAAALNPDGGVAQDGFSISVDTTSMDDVARMIRRHKRWEILDARQRLKGSEMRYRFKLINNTGKVMIISIDPRNPNLRKLEQ